MNGLGNIYLEHPAGVFHAFYTTLFPSWDTGDDDVMAFAAGGKTGMGQAMPHAEDKAGSRSELKDRKRKKDRGGHSTGSSQALTSFLKRANVQQQS